MVRNVNKIYIVDNSYEFAKIVDKLDIYNKLNVEPGSFDADVITHICNAIEDEYVFYYDVLNDNYIVIELEKTWLQT